MGQGHSQPEIAMMEAEQPAKTDYKVAVVCGSVRKASTNAGLIKAIYQAKDQRFFFQWVEISHFPLFNEDIEALGYPPEVQAARDVVAKADAILFAVPEYNFSVSAPMKNAYDWLSREDKNKVCPVQNKIAAMISSGGGEGGSKAQDNMRQVVEFRKMNLLKPSKEGELLVKRWGGKFFDDNGHVIDEDLKKRIKQFLNQFATHIKNNKK